ncbi:glycosyltransferase family 2 protein [Candidatus Thioglobus sp.]|nr:glycosyltransferase family 2 protein [Candidatus Thioglobus sp.]
MDKPIFSIVCATYNRAHSICRTIDSVVKQDFHRWELVIIDDGSVDSTKDLVKKYLPDKRIKYIRLDVNKGVGFARNAGILRANSNWIVLLDSDNALTSDAISKMYKAIQLSPDILIHKFSVVSFDNKKMCDTISSEGALVGLREYICDKHKGEFHTLTRKKLLEENPFPENFNGGEGVVWSKVVSSAKFVLYHAEVTEKYEMDGSDRLSLKKGSYYRLSQIFFYDISNLWVLYLRHSPLQLFLRIGKFMVYRARSEFDNV